jgi:ParB family chromosome partitioning protein
MALGRGLASLIPKRKERKLVSSGKVAIGQLDDGLGKVFLNQESGQLVKEVELSQIKSNPYQPRKYFNPEKLEELSNSISQYGILQPLVVSGNEKEGYLLIAGERRLEASKKAGLSKIPVIVKEVDDQERLELALVENIQRHDLNPIEEARGYKLLWDEFGLSQEQIAQRIGKNRSTVTNLLRLLELPVEIQKGLIEGKITSGHARSILGIKNPEKQLALYQQILKEGLTVRDTESRSKMEISSKVKVVAHNRALKDPEMIEIQKGLEESLGTKVEIKKSGRVNKLVIDFSDKKELNDILEKMSNL